jgi:hypothetical protein
MTQTLPDVALTRNGGGCPRPSGARICDTLGNHCALTRWKACGFHTEFSCLSRALGGGLRSSAGSLFATVAS